MSEHNWLRQQKPEQKGESREYEKGLKDSGHVMCLPPFHANQKTLE